MSILKKRDHYRPFQYPWAFEAYDMMQKMHWLPSEVPLQEDVVDWSKKLTAEERNLLTQLFRFFTQADADIATGYAELYMKAFPIPEIRMMLFSFGSAEANHMHAYSQLLDTVGMPEVEYQAFGEFAAMKEKHEYLFADRAEGLDDRKRSKIEKLALDLAVFSAFGEGMQLFSSFALLLSFKRRNLMKGMSTIVEWSLRDETHHVESMIKLFHTLIQENPRVWTDELKRDIYQTAREMVELEDRFIDLAFEMGPVAGVTAEETKQYIRFIADRRLLQLGLKPNYGQKDNPFEWLDEMMTAITHTNFFEGRATEYSKGGVVGWNPTTWDFLDGMDLPGRTVGEQVVVYTKDFCPYCALLKAELTRRDIPFTVVDLTDDKVREEFYANAGVTTVPQLFITSEGYSEKVPSGRRIGGYSDVAADWSQVSYLG
jgi:ribonucleoside-diphosphate reductase beta chain